MPYTQTTTKTTPTPTPNREMQKAKNPPKVPIFRTHPGPKWEPVYKTPFSPDGGTHKTYSLSSPKPIRPNLWDSPSEKHNQIMDGTRKTVYWRDPPPHEETTQRDFETTLCNTQYEPIKSEAQ